MPPENSPVPIRLRKSGLLILLPVVLGAQQQNNAQPAAPPRPVPFEQQILDRLDRLERENRALADEVRGLRADLAAAAHVNAPAEPSSSSAQAGGASPASPPLHEQVELHAQRIDDLAQTKVESAQKLPVTLNGMVLFNAFLNGRAGGGAQDPTIASPADNRNSGGASPAQSIVGLAFEGPRVAGGGQVSGSLQMDLWGGTPASSLGHTLRLRTGDISIEWKNTTITAGQDKPLISPRDPTSLAQVAFSPLTAAGNLWLWQPQVRAEQRFAIGESTGLRAQLGVYQTSEPAASAGEYASTLAAARPALEGRFELWHNFAPARRIEIAPGFHVSDTHVGGFTVPSRLFSMDWKIQPAAKVQFTGAFFNGENAAGLGGLRQGFTVLGDRNIRPVHGQGGWAQLSYQATGRLSFNLYGGQESNRPRDLLGGGIARNFAYAANGMYRIGPNVLVAIEAAQVRTAFVGLQNRLNNHYDVALAYLF